jgi:hypothetical protein
VENRGVGVGGGFVRWLTSLSLFRFDTSSAESVIGPPLQSALEKANRLGHCWKTSKRLLPFVLIKKADVQFPSS